MSALPWEDYRIDLAPRPLPAAGPLRAKPVVRPLASRSARLVAFLLDTCLFVLSLVVGFVLTQSSGESADTTTVRVVLWAVGSLAVLAVQWVLLAVRGQTLGKLAIGVRIANEEDEGNPGFYRAVILRNWVPADPRLPVLPR